MTFWQLLTQSFVVNALIAVALVALAAGAIGYFVVVRRQAFAAHAIGHVGFAGAAGAVWLGLSPVVGLLVLCVGAGAAIGLGARELDERDAVVGITLTGALGLGVLFISLYSGYANATYSILFGQILGVSHGQLVSLLVMAVVTFAALSVIARPLLFASVDPQAARSRGVAVGAISVVFMVMLAVATVAAIQVVGVLLTFSLLVAPGATASVMTVRPWRGVVVSTVVALVSGVGGVVLAVWRGGPPSFWITSLATVSYIGARGFVALRRRGVFR